MLCPTSVIFWSQRPLPVALSPTRSQTTMRQSEEPEMRTESSYCRHRIDPSWPLSVLTHELVRRSQIRIERSRCGGIDISDCG